MSDLGSCLLVWCDVDLYWKEFGQNMNRSESRSRVSAGFDPAMTFCTDTWSDAL